MGGGITAAHVATALVAACREVGVRPDQAFEEVRGAKKARVLAGAGLVAAIGAKAADVCRLLQLKHRVVLSPSHLPRWAISKADIAMVVEALQDAELTPRVFEAAPAPAAEPPVQDKPARIEAVEAPARAAPGERKARPAALERKPRRALGDPKPGPRPRTALPEKAIQKLKPVTARIVRWARFFPAAQWSLGEVAELFDVCPVQLLEAMGPVPAPPMGVPLGRIDGRRPASAEAA